MRDPELLYGPEPASSAWRSNVILLNGLKGDARTTWTPPIPPSGDVWWKRLSDGLGGASILSFDVPQEVVRSVDEDDITLEQNAGAVLELIQRAKLLNTKTLFVGYSFGGILLKLVLADMLSREPKHFRPRLGNITGLVFLGVPHKGSPWANKGIKVIRSLRRSRLMSQVAGTSHLEDVQQDSRILNIVGDRFQVAWDSKFATLPIVSVVEQRRIIVETILSKRVPKLDKIVRRLPQSWQSAVLGLELDRLIVDSDAAVLNLETESVLGADCCHMALPWFQFDGAAAVLDHIIQTFGQSMTSNPDGEADFRLLTDGIAA